MKDKNTIAKKVQSIRKGDTSAMKFLYDLFAREMLTLSYRITDNLADAEDIIQDSFMHSFKVINQLKDERNFGPWLKRIVLNNSLKRIKKRPKFVVLDHDEIEDFDDTSRWYDTIPPHQVREAIQSLPNGCRQIVTLFLLDNYKHREIAEMLEISVSTSKSQYQYGLKALRKNLKQYANE